ncbi:MAG TPA: NnrU family protein [Steroidobacteraceae bacterium]|nr:NnrU family protein [Steroidobacteraceae bacterium]
MMLLILGLVIFLGVHSIAIVAPSFRDAARSRMGDGAWKALYGLASLVGFILLCYGFGLARQAPVVLYVPPHWLRSLALLVMLPVFPLVFAVYLPGRIKTAAQHPMLAAVKFWGFAHLLANGNLGDVLLFGGLLAWAVVDRISLKSRPTPPRNAVGRSSNDVVAVVLGLATYALFVFWAHRLLFGVSPLA